MAKSTKKTKTKPWLTAYQDGSCDSYIMLDVSIMKHPGFCRLTHGTRIVYLAMCQEAQQSVTFTFPDSKCKQYGFSSSKLRRAVSELTAAGFLKTSANGKTMRTPNEYTFDFAWKGEHPDFKRREKTRALREKTEAEIQSDREYAQAAADYFLEHMSTTDNE